MKAKIVGFLLFLAGTATVFAATHVSLYKDANSTISGVAGISEGLGMELKLEMEIVGLKPNAVYVAKIGSASCQSQNNGTGIAAFIVANDFGSYSSVMRGMPTSVKTARSINLYSDNSDQSRIDVENVYCLELG
jgi:hypothetical protein